MALNSSSANQLLDKRVYVENNKKDKTCNKWNLLNAFTVVSCAVPQIAIAQVFQTATWNPSASDGQTLLAVDSSCANKLLDERVYVWDNQEDYICGWTPASGYGYGSNTIYLVDYLGSYLVTINFEFDGNGNVNVSDEYLDDLITNANKVFDDQKELWSQPWRRFFRDFVLQFGDDTAKSQNNLDNIFANNNSNKAFENSIVSIASTLGNKTTLTYVGEFIRGKAFVKKKYFSSRLKLHSIHSKYFRDYDLRQQQGCDQEF